MSEDEYTALRKEARDLPPVPEAWNIMLPTTLKVVGVEADHEGMAAYLETALFRAAELGGSIVVFGSAPSRRVPEDWPRDEALKQFEDACLRAGKVARKHGITLAVEPLPSSTVNLVNCVAEGARVVD
ncbi:MAG: sugar phosphate isomerase/epimerase [Chloroflexota bacterium]|nr:sugar phosphate isomerase/epimerase [Chloroflexota bacterium]